MKFIFMCGIGLSFMQTPVYIFMRWFTPCTSGTFVYFLIPACHNPVESQEWSFSSNALLFCICIIMTWFFIQGIEGWCTVAVDISLVAAYCLHRYQRLIQVSLESKSPKKVAKGLKLYRKLQVLNRYYNLIQQDSLVFFNHTFLTNAIIVCTFTLISLGGNIRFLNCSCFRWVHKMQLWGWCCIAWHCQK